MKRLRDLDKRTRKAALKVKLLSSLSWPEGEIQRFLTSWREGSPELPRPELERRDLTEVREALAAVVREASADEPLEAYVRATAQSYLDAAQMLEVVGEPRFTELSVGLYGHPRDPLVGAHEITHADAARRLLDNTSALTEAGVVPEDDICITPQSVQEELRADFDAFFGDAAPKVVIDPKLASKAAAGATRVRLRGHTCFSDLDVAQLREHEGFVHTATALNGRAQKNLSTMRLSAPRTTRTQEGLATVAELITRAIDIARLRRLALRTLAIDAALEGADFVEVFRLFLDAGQSEAESARSATRVFRGGDTSGGVAFTKDVVYLAGLIEVHSYLRKAIEQSRPELVARLFVGRLTLEDLSSLDPAMDDGRIAPPRFVPAWATDMPRLGAYLAFSALTDLVDLRRLKV